jgi:hypothetical protein
MEYQELIAKALNGRSVNSMARQWGVAQPTLDRYVKGYALPNYDLALKIVKEAGIDPAEGFEILAKQERQHRVKNFKLKAQDGFVQTDLLFILGGGWIVAILSILCQMRCVKHRRTR